MKTLTTLFLSIILLNISACTAGLDLKGNSMSFLEQAKPVQSSILAKPLIQKKETITATGYSVISKQNDSNPAQQRLLAIRAAKLDAYRTLTEQVYGLNLDASTTVADMTVQNDTFRTKVEGVIYGAKLISITPTGNDTYETTLTLDMSVVEDLRALYLTQTTQTH